MSSSTIVRLRPEPSSTKATKRTPRATRRLRQQAMAGTGIATVALTLTGLSLTHLSHGIELVTNAPQWQSWAMAIGIDLGFVAMECAQITAATDKLRKAIARFTKPAIMGTLAGSALLNAFAFSNDATGWHAPFAAAIGLTIPALVFALTRVGTAMWIDR